MCYFVQVPFIYYAKRHKTKSNAQVTIESMINWFRKSDFGGLNLGVAVFYCRITWYIIC